MLLLLSFLLTVFGSQLVDFDAGMRDFHLLHFVSTGEGEITRQVDVVAVSLQFTLGHGAVAVDVDGYVVNLDFLILPFLHLDAGYADGQFTAQLLAHQGRAGLGDVNLEGGLAAGHADVGHVEGFVNAYITSGGSSEDVLVGIVDGEHKIEVAHLSVQLSGKLLFFPEHVELSDV